MIWINFAMFGFFLSERLQISWRNTRWSSSWIWCGLMHDYDIKSSTQPHHHQSLLQKSTKQSRCERTRREEYTWMLFITGDVSGFPMSTTSNMVTSDPTWTLSMLPCGFSPMALSPLPHGMFFMITINIFLN